MKAEISRLLKELKEALQRIYGDNFRGLYLYGSYASHKEHPESDVDVLIVLKDFSDYWQEVKRTSDVIARLSLKYGVSISPVRVREADWLHDDSPFLNSTRKESVPL